MSVFKAIAISSIVLVRFRGFIFTSKKNDSTTGTSENHEQFAKNTSLKGEELEMKQKVQATMQTALDILLSNNNWIRESDKDSSDVIESKRVNGNKVFRAQAVINTSTDNLISILFDNFETQPKWNPTVLKCEIIKTIDSNTDLAYTVSAPACMGIVTSRDFIVLRYKATVENSIVIASISIQTLLVPENKLFIRGENGPSCFLISPIPGKPKQCELRWLLNTNLNGWLPQNSVDKALSSVIKDYLKYLRDFIAGIPPNILYRSLQQPQVNTRIDANDN